jgi:hypothetical protein
MKIAIVSGGSVLLHVGLSDDWMYGDEKVRHHVLVAVEEERAEALWSIRKKSRAVAEFIEVHGESLIRERLADRMTPSADDIEAFRETMARSVPELSSIAPGANAEVSREAWLRARTFIGGWERLLELGAPEVVIDAKRRELAQLVVALAMPSLLGYGAVFDSLRALVHEATGVCVRRPIEDLGLGVAVGYFERLPPALTRPSERFLAGQERIHLVTRAEWTHCLALLLARQDGDATREALLQAQARLASSNAGLFFHAVSEWRDWVDATASDFSDDDNAGVYVAV